MEWYTLGSILLNASHLELHFTLKQVLLPASCDSHEKTQGEVNLLKVTQVLSGGGTGASEPRQRGPTLSTSH